MRTGKSDYKIIRVVPTLDTNAYDVADVFLQDLKYLMQ